MKLTIPERIVLSTILPSKGNYLTLQLVRTLTEKLNLTQEEIEQAEVKDLPNGVIRCNQKKGDAIEKDIEVSEPELTVIKKELNDRDNKKELTVHQMSVYEKFVLNPSEPKKA